MKRLIKKDIITFVFVLCCSACTLNTKQNDKHLSSVKPKDNIVTLRGEMMLLGDTLPGVLGIVVADKYILTVSDERTPLFTALTKNGARVADFGHKGHATSEFTTTSILKQYTEDGCIVANDINANKLKLIDLHKTIDEKRTVVKRTIEMPPASLESWYVDSGRQIVLQQHADNFSLHQNGKSIKDPKKLYEPHAPAFPLYQSRLCASPNGRKVALPMMYMDKINFYDFEKDHLSSVSVYDAPASKDDELHVYYCSTCTDGDKVYALYMNQSNEDSYDVPKNMEIHVLDFDGVYLGRYVVQEYIIDIDCDDESLYGLDLEGNIYKFTLPKLKG